MRSESTRLNSSHTEIYTLSLHDALPIYSEGPDARRPTFFWLRPSLLKSAGRPAAPIMRRWIDEIGKHTSELQSHRDLHSFPTRRSSDLLGGARRETTHVLLATTIVAQECRKAGCADYEEMDR